MIASSRENGKLGSLGYFRGAREFFPQGTFKDVDLYRESLGAGVCHGSCCPVDMSGIRETNEQDEAFYEKWRTATKSMRLRMGKECRRKNQLDVDKLKAIAEAYTRRELALTSEENRQKMLAAAKRYAQRTFKT